MSNQLHRLERLIEDIDRARPSGDAKKIIEDLVEREGARHRYISGTYELRMAGVAATSTIGGNSLLTAWQRAATRKISKIIGAS